MPRAATTTDVFNALAEPRRRQIIDQLASKGALAVGALVLTLGIPQPAVSKHLGVLRKVGVVSVTREGQHRLYQLEASELKRIYDWIKRFEAFWSHQLGRIKERSERRARSLEIQCNPHSQRKVDHDNGHNGTGSGSRHGDSQGVRDRRAD
jgi:DNA-binding transcriptional ArsR family regulator